MPTTTLRRSALAVACGLGALALAVPAAQAHDDGDGHTSSGHLTRHQRHVVKHATAKLRTPAAAIKAGFQATDACVAAPGVGGMGYHFFNLDNVMDGVTDPAKPEILVFVPTKNGTLRLGAVEYFQPDSDQDPATTDDRPYLFGKYPFDGPMAGHEEGQPVHYDLHVWLYKHNPSGQLAPFNPDVHCPTVS